MKQAVILILYILDSMRNTIFFIYTSALVLYKTKFIHFCHKTFPNPSTLPFPRLFVKTPILIPASFPSLPPPSFLPYLLLSTLYSSPSSLSSPTPPSCYPVALPFLPYSPHCTPLPPTFLPPLLTSSPTCFGYHNKFWAVIQHSALHLGHMRWYI